MGKSMIIVGAGNTPAPSASTAEQAALEYFVNRKLAGDWPPRPPVERWRADQRERFEAELARLESRSCRDAQ